MPRYFFHVIDGAGVRDEEGTKLPNIDMARDQAIQMTGEILRDLGGRFRSGATWRLEVADEQEQVLFVLHVSAEERLPHPGSVASLETGQGGGVLVDHGAP